MEDLCFKGAPQGIYKNTINRERLEENKRGKEEGKQTGGKRKGSWENFSRHPS